MLILKELHDKLDLKIADAYGWPAVLPDNDILARLVALNRERVQEEAAGQVGWLRPDYQIPRFGSEVEKLALTGGALREPAAAGPGPKASFPTKKELSTDRRRAVGARLGEYAAHRHRARRAVPPGAPRATAGRGRARVGGLIHSPDGGRSFVARRAA